MAKQAASPTDVDVLRRGILFSEQLRGRTLTFHSTWGLFNPRHVDEGSRLLIDRIEVEPGDTCLDLGCGYGPIGLTLAGLCAPGEAHLVDKDFVAVEHARRNAQANHLDNVRVYLSNAFSHVPDIPFDCIASNLPAKVGNEMLTVIMHDARSRLRPGGRFYVVTISGLKEYIKRNFRAIFGNYTKVKQGKTYTVALAVRE
jgi:16S rRNA (guanine1207-N2)-methyltransferase